MSNTNIDALNKVIQILTPIDSENRKKIIRAALTMLGDEESNIVSSSGKFQPNEVPSADLGDNIANLPKARAWMKQNSISLSSLEDIFHFDAGRFEVIASSVPGTSKKDQTFSAYMITGLGSLLTTGEPAFNDKDARGLCERLGCYDQANHSSHMKNRGNEFTGDKNKGWTLTAPGLKRAAELVKEMLQND